MTCANHPDRERIAFCQNCGKPLCAECSRTVGNSVFCEPCLAARLAAGPAGTPNPAEYTTVPFASPAAPPAASASDAANPILAGALGFIPGVAAMYNGQYAKGVVHLLVFAVLVKLTDASGTLGILVAGWVFYQVFDGYHTARARRDGTPLPNPFNLNDIGERLGFQRGWTPAPATPAAPFSPGAPFQPPPPSYQATAADPAYPPPPTSNPGNPWDKPWETYLPPQAPYAPIDPATAEAAGRNYFPIGAIILIGLGVLFFFGSSGLLRGFPVYRLLPFLPIGFGVWLFIHKMTDGGASLTGDGATGYRLRLFNALRGSVWIVLAGVLFLLDTFGILSWGQSWPFFIILAGVMTLLQRFTAGAPAPLPYSYPPPYPPAAAAPSAPYSAPSPGSALVQTATHVPPAPARGEEGS